MPRTPPAQSPTCLQRPTAIPAGRALGRAPAAAGVAALLAVSSLAGCAAPGATAGRGVKFAVSIPKARTDSARDGRVLVLLATDSTSEPRFQVEPEPDRSAEVAGVQVHGFAPGGEVVVGDTAFGYPVASLRDVPAGDYTVQAVFVPYRTYHRADGHTVSLPPDRGEGQHWDRKPGDLFSVPRRMHLDPAPDRTVRLSLDSVIPELSPPEDTPWVKHVRIRSALLTKFWGTPTYIQATVLLPAGFAEHPGAHYPLLVEQGHFGRGIPGWRPEPEDASLPAPDSTWLYAHCWMGNEAGCREHGIERMRQRLMHGFYQWWTSPNAPRVLLLTIQHANPYYDDSYAVNSANLGPYGDAITRELIPEVEKRYRGIGAGWARVLTGGSTGGWEALGVQMFYPDDYNGAWGFCPDPVDFHFHQAVDVYDDANAYLRSGPLGGVAVPGARGYQGRVRYQMADENHMELALGTRGRSGGQWDIWQAVFGPVGADGYPKPIWDKRTGVIDHEVAAYWRDHYDLTHILQRDWKTLGPKLRGKLHVYVGTMDSYYLNDAVHLMQEAADSLRNPRADFTFDYGARAPHCWTGDHDHPNWAGSITAFQRFLPAMARHMESTAPTGADTRSWRY